MPMSAARTSPQKGAERLRKWAGLAAAKVMVRSARKVSALQKPFPQSIPLGRSKAARKAPERLAAAIQRAGWPRSSPAKPVPKQASTMTPALWQSASRSNSSNSSAAASRTGSPASRERFSAARGESLLPSR